MAEERKTHHAEGRANSLIHEKSPYLLKHAYNPVNWYPWGEAAFRKAREEDKPILLSIGYSTCHWCNVMEHESYSDPEVGALMNDVFVSIKVDREERPDIDNLYMAVCQMISRQGCGWPLNILMTPEKKPFYAATYIPKTGRFGRSGMLELIPSVKLAWKEDREKVLSSADAITDLLKKNSGGTRGEELEEEVLQAAYTELEKTFDEKYGGFGESPKFPSPHNLFFLLRYQHRSGDEKALAMVEETLRAMRRGGIYDHIGFGFHRYSTDREWLLPHFEKMLCDQALLAMAYIEAYQVTGEIDYKKTAQEIFTYVLRDMTSPEGGFYSAEDADSEGEEGKFYFWTREEIEEALSREESNMALRIFNIQSDGNFVDPMEGRKIGVNIPHRKETLKKMSSELHLKEEALEEQLEKVRKKLFNFRAKRVHPYKDDKILADWNGLMIAALAKGARAFGEPHLLRSASRAADFILSRMRNADGRLLHRYRENEAAIPGMLDDYAYVTWGLLELYESSFEVSYLKAAMDITRDMEDHFWDNTDGGFFLAPDDGDRLLVRRKDFNDGAAPSGNSVSMLNLLRLSRLTAMADLEEKAQGIARSIAGSVHRFPTGHTHLLSALDFGLGPSYEVVIVGDREAEDTKAMLDTLQRQFFPNMVTIFRPLGTEPAEITQIAPFTQDQKAINGRATAYVCLRHNCKLPTTDVKEMLKLLRGD